MRDSSLSRHPPGSFAELAAVALPLILSSGSVSLAFFTDRMFLTWYSTAALAAALPAGMLHWTVLSLAIGTVTYVNTFVAQYDGAGNKSRASASVWQAAYLSFAAGVCFLVVVPFAPAIFRLIGHEIDIQTLETEYFSLLCYGAVPMTLATALSCFFSGRGATMVVMLVNLLASLLNIGLNSLLIFGNGPFPEMGIRGAALATVISQTSAVVIYFAILWRERHSDYAFFQHWRFDSELFRRLLRYGLPTGFQYLADISAFAIFIFFVGRIGGRQLAATNLSFNMNTLAFIPMLGCGTAVMTLVGQRIGEGRPQLAVRTTWLACGVSTIYMGTFAVIYLFAPDLILSLYAFKSAPEEFALLREQAIPLLRFLAFFSVFDGMAIIFGSAVRGAGDTRFSLVFTLITGWLLMVTPTWLAWKWPNWIAWEWFGGNLYLSWTACTVYICVLGIGLLIRFQSGRWKSMRVIESPEPETPDVVSPENEPANSPDHDVLPA